MAWAMGRARLLETCAQVTADPSSWGFQAVEATDLMTLSYLALWSQTSHSLKEYVGEKRVYQLCYPNRVIGRIKKMGQVEEP